MRSGIQLQWVIKSKWSSCIKMMMKGMCGTGTCDICFRRNFYKSQSEVQSLYRKWHTSFKLKYKIKKKTSDIFKEKNIKFCLYVDGKLVRFHIPQDISGASTLLLLENAKLDTSAPAFNHSSRLDLLYWGEHVWVNISSNTNNQCNSPL